MTSADSGDSDTSTPNNSTEVMAAHNPQAILDEVAAYRGDDDSFTRRVAAANMSRLDDREWVVTNGKNVRRAYDAPNSTAAIARSMVDLQAAFEGQQVDPADRRALAIQQWAREHNARLDQDPLPVGMDLAPEGSDEWRAASEAIIQRMIEQARERRR